MCSPSLLKSWSTAALGGGFMAKRTVTPYACGNDSAVSACWRSDAASYTKSGEQNSSRI